VAHLRKSDRLRRRKRMERTAGPRSCIHLAAMVAATFAVVGMGSGLVSGSMTAASAAVVRSSDLSPHGASVPNTPDSVVAISPTPDDKGYLTITANGFVSAYGDGVFAGGQAGGPAPVVGIQTGEDTGGFWTVRADGGVFTIGDVPFYGSMGGKTLNAPVVGMALTPDREGYWLVAADGGVFSFGNAHFYGSTGALQMRRSMVRWPVCGSMGQSSALQRPRTAWATGWWVPTTASSRSETLRSLALRRPAPATTTTTAPSSPSVAFVQADDTGTINGNTTSIGSGQSNQVLAHDTGIGHSVVLMIQTLPIRTAPRRIPSPASPQGWAPSSSSTRTTMVPTTRYGSARTRPAQPTRSRSPRRPMPGTPWPWSSTLPPLAS
jgi:hypothetical protein